MPSPTKRERDGGLYRAIASTASWGQTWKGPGIAAALNARSIKTARGGCWTHVQNGEWVLAPLTWLGGISSGLSRSIADGLNRAPSCWPGDAARLLGRLVRRGANTGRRVPERRIHARGLFRRLGAAHKGKHFRQLSIPAWL